MNPSQSDEFIDVLDNTGKPIGQVCPRSLVHKYGYFHATVHIWVANSNHGLLLQKRSSSKDIYPGKWDISCAGHLTAGDTSLDAAIRELYEELGVEVRISDLHFVCNTVQSYSSPDGLIQDNEFTDVYFLTLHNDQLFRSNPQEVDALQYVSIETFNRMVTSADPQLVPHNMDEIHKIIEILSNLE